MKKIEVVGPVRFESSDRTGAPERGLRIRGAGRRRAASPAHASIWLDVLEVEAGARLEREEIEGELVLFVETGGVEVDVEVGVGVDVDGAICARETGDSRNGVDAMKLAGAGSAVVFEAQARAAIEVRSASRLLLMGAAPSGSSALASPTGSPTRAGRAVHVIGPRGRFEAIEPGRDTRFFADATCESCEAWLLFTARSFAYESPLHSHSRDELIHVLQGEIAIGSLRVAPGSTVFIAADQPYRFRSGDSGFAFLNYRSAGSIMTLKPSGERIVENARATGMRPTA